MGVDYEKVADSEPDDYKDYTVSEANGSQTHLSRRVRFDRASTGLTLLNIFLFIFSATLCGIAYLHRPRTNSQALQEVLAYSPLLDHIEFQFEYKQVEGTLFDEDFLSREELVLRGHSNNKSDAAWEALTKIQRIPATADEVRRLGKDPGSTVRIPAKYGFGDKTHAIQLDAQHNLHCLNMIRQYAYREYYFPEVVDTVRDGTSPLPEIHQAHLAHCLSVLRQTLTCNPSLEVLVHRWVKDQIYPFPDFNVNKKCVKHNQILDWQAKNGLPDEKWYEVTAEGPGEDATVFEPPPKLLKWTSEFNSVEKS